VRPIHVGLEGLLRQRAAGHNGGGENDALNFPFWHGTPSSRIFVLASWPLATVHPTVAVEAIFFSIPSDSSAQ
jgi:hypothetical protein